MSGCTNCHLCEKDRPLNTLQNRIGWRRTSWSCAILGALALVLMSCGLGANNSEFVTKIPGTEDMAGAVGSMYVSPDERWITFFTLDRKSYLYNGLVSVELATGHRVEHHLDLVADDERAENERELYDEILGSMGNNTGWHDGRLYLPLLRVSNYLAVDNSDSTMVFVKLTDKRPQSPLMLSDGPEWGTWRRALNSRLDRSNRAHDRSAVEEHSAAWQNNGYAANMYRWNNESNSIVSDTPGQGAKRIFDVSGGGFFSRTVLGELRVSPNESYLAYIVASRPRFIPSPVNQDNVHVIDLASGRDQLICRFRLAGNLQWSPDGNRLYLTGNNPDETRGVYVINVAKAFK